jgi:hypothetical protein
MMEQVRFSTGNGVVDLLAIKPLTIYKAEWVESKSKQPPDAFEQKSLAIKIASNLNPHIRLRIKQEALSNQSLLKAR